MKLESRRIPRATPGRHLRARRSRLLLGAVLVPLMLPVPAFAVVFVCQTRRRASRATPGCARRSCTAR